MLFSILPSPPADTRYVIQDTPFWQDYHEAYPLKTAGENDVRAVAVDTRGRVWAATAEGVHWLEGGQWKTPPGGENLGPTFDVVADGQEGVWIGAWNGLYRATSAGLAPTEIKGIPIGVVQGGGKATLFAGGPSGIWQQKAGRWEKVPGVWGTALRALLPVSEQSLWIGTISGLYRHDLSGKTLRAEALSKPTVLLSSNVYALAQDKEGQVWIGTSGGIDVYREGKRVRSLGVKQGLPNRHARALAWDADGRLWVATRLGVARYDGKSWSLRHSPRWLLSDEARDVAIGPDGTAWVATANGVSAIRRKQMTLADKAEHYLHILRARHLRFNFVGPALLETPGDLSRSRVIDDDNDGEHTGMYCATESFRYAVTGNPEARENAKAAFHALEQLRWVTGTEHFIARCMLPLGTDPLNDLNHRYSPQERAETNHDDPRYKIVEERWIPSPDGKWLWKRDASSDEVDGHMFGYTTYFDLAADAEEKKRVAAQVDALIGGIVDHGLVLQDIDGKATRWGVWSPEQLNGNPNWHEERPGNSVEILAHLSAAHHITGKPRYLETLRTLIEKHGYGQNVLLTEADTPSERTHINDELLSITYPALLNYAPNPALKRLYQQSVQRWHRPVKRDGGAMYDFTYNRFSGRKVSLAGAAECLRDWPLDMIEWTVDNRFREDVERDTTPGVEENFLKRMVPRSEMGICNWDQEPYKMVIGDGGRREDRSIDWILAYWAGRYFGFITPPMGGSR